MIVKIERYYDFPDIKRQSKNESFKWGDILFTEEDVKECDYLVILEHPKKDFTIKVPSNNIIHICQEPPNEVSKYRQFSNKNVNYNFNQLENKKNNILSHGALPWFINKNYDYLKELNPNDLVKENTVAWVTSNQKSSLGHQQRMDFCDRIKKLPFVKMYGRGIKPIHDKWDALSISKYSIAYENFESQSYWTEKIVDCFLSYSMPIYYGCTTISNFFPKGSYIELDPKDKHIDLFFKEIIKSNTYENSLDLISEARNLILEQYQLLPFLHNQIVALESVKGAVKEEKQEFFFKGGDAYFNNAPLSVLVKKAFHKTKRKVLKKIKND